MGALKSLGRSAVMSFSLFSKIPMPRVEWKEESMRYVMCFFPLVGAVEGALLALWLWAAFALSFSAPLCAAGLLGIPVLVTGGIHLDGFCDVCDALSSHAEPARKREILKDPHVGAFAVIFVATYLLVYFGIACDLGFVGHYGAFDPEVAWGIALIPVLSRCLSGIATLAFPKSSSKGMLSMEASSDAKGRALGALGAVFAATVVLAVATSGILGIALVVVALLCLLWLRRLADREFGGMSGDLAGWFLQVAELAMLACLVLCKRILILGVFL